ncbi:hypothetical protein [Geovibrio ferrireducens]|uniref:hypothetical protein n=1 Tax=Geovibrio ferrireducens TaxID=46201 RepID=UPI00224666F0|nr:hypothetical protein [Geovibrio ferrireducens]
MLTVKAKIIAFFAALGAVLFAVWTLFQKGKKAGYETAKNEQTEKDLSHAAAELSKNEEAKDLFTHHASEMREELKKHEETEKARKEEAQSTSFFDIGKWAVIVVCFLALASCTAKHVTVYKTTVPYFPQQEIFSRPQYKGEPVSFADNGTQCFDKASFTRIADFIEELKTAVRKYETQAAMTNEYVSTLREIYQTGGDE